MENINLAGKIINNCSKNQSKMNDILNVLDVLYPGVLSPYPSLVAMYKNSNTNLSDTDENE